LIPGDHPERQRVPKGFGADFHLHLESINGGSAKAMLAVVGVGAQALGDGANAYFERARDLITECVGAADGQLPAGFPRELLVYFNQVGRSLRPDECMEFPQGASVAATLTPERRKKLVLAADTVYERPIELTGPIIEANWEKSTFQIRLTDGTAAVVPMPESFHPHASTGVWAVTKAEADAEGAEGGPDPLPDFPAHAKIDFGILPEKACWKIAKRLKSFALARGCRFGPPPAQVAQGA
jgi:hypothetical protein